ncbi:MAG: hypothetical protein U5J63_00695 [Fodinibius sp.]|nr:hypothetical protein [Fodinibius sp.]
MNNYHEVYKKFHQQEHHPLKGDLTLDSVKEMFDKLEQQEVGANG